MMQIYDNPISVLTNSPPFDWQMSNLQNYLNLKPENPDPILFRGVPIGPPGQGSGFLGMPGDWSPPSRFVKIATYLRFAKQTASCMEAVNLAEHLLNTVDIPLGEVRDPGKETGDYTQWIVIKDLTQKVFYFRSYSDLVLKSVDMKKLNFDQKISHHIPIDVKKGYLDVTQGFLIYRGHPKSVNLGKRESAWKPILQSFSVYLCALCGGNCKFSPQRTRGAQRE